MSSRGGRRPQSMGLPSRLPPLEGTPSRQARLPPLEATPTPPSMPEMSSPSPLATRLMHGTAATPEPPRGHLRMLQGMRRSTPVRASWPPAPLPGTSGAGWGAPPPAPPAVMPPQPAAPSVQPGARRRPHSRARASVDVTHASKPLPTHSSAHMSTPSQAKHEGPEESELVGAGGQPGASGQSTAQRRAQSETPPSSAQREAAPDTSAAAKQKAVAALQRLFFEELAKGGDPNAAAAQALLRLNEQASPQESAAAEETGGAFGAMAEQQPPTLLRPPTPLVGGPQDRRAIRVGIRG